jgi:hypothetical protein
MFYDTAKRTQVLLGKEMLEIRALKMSGLPFSDRLKKLAHKDNRWMIKKRLLGSIEVRLLYGEGLEGRLQQVQMVTDFQRTYARARILMEKLDLRVNDKHSLINVTPFDYFIFYNKAIIDVLTQARQIQDPEGRHDYGYYQHYRLYYDLLDEYQLSGLALFDLFEPMLKVVFPEEEAFREKCLRVQKLFAEVLQEMEKEHFQANAIGLRTQAPIPQL